MTVEVHDSGKSIKRYRAGAKDLVKSEGIPLHVALDRMAQKFHDDNTPNWLKDDPSFDHTLNWAELSKGLWKLGDDNILRRRHDNVLSYPDGSAPKKEEPIFVRYEIENPMLTNSDAVMEGLNLATLGSRITMRSRIKRWVESDGTLVKRQVVRQSGECFDRPANNWRYSAACDCCIRHEIRCDEGSDGVNECLLKKAVSTWKKTDIACFSVDEFRMASSDPYPMQKSGTGWLTSSPEAEKIVQKLVKRYELRDELQLVS